MHVQVGLWDWTTTQRAISSQALPSSRRDPTLPSDTQGQAVRVPSPSFLADLGNGAARNRKTALVKLAKEFPQHRAIIQWLGGGLYNGLATFTLHLLSSLPHRMESLLLST